MGKINIINNTDEKAVVTLNHKHNGIQIIIGPEIKKVSLGTLKPGDVFKECGVGYIVMEQVNVLQMHLTRVIRKEVLYGTMTFNACNNNWKSGCIRRYLNKEYLEELHQAFGKGSIIKQAIDLTSFDGIIDYGRVYDHVSLLDLNGYRKYRNVIGTSDKEWWLLTPGSTHSDENNYLVTYVSSDGGVHACYNDEALFVRPVFYMDSNVMVERGNEIG